jgi:hypothetical protein
MAGFNLYVGELDKGAEKNEFPWQQLMQNKMAELQQFNTYMGAEERFQGREQAKLKEMEDSFAQMLERGVNMPLGNKQAFEKKYVEEKNKLLEEMKHYSSVQGFIANGGSAKMSEFASNVLGSEEFAFGMQSSRMVEDYRKGLLNGKEHFMNVKVVGKDGSISYVNPNDAIVGIHSGDYKTAFYGGVEDTTFEVPDPIRGMRDEFWTPEEIYAHALKSGKTESVAKRQADNYAQVYNPAEGRGYYKMVTDQNFVLGQEQNRLMGAKIKQAAASGGGGGSATKQPDLYWNDAKANKGATFKNGKAQPVNWVDMTSATEEYQAMGIKKVKVTTKDEGGNAVEREVLLPNGSVKPYVLLKETDLDEPDKNGATAGISYETVLKNAKTSTFSTSDDSKYLGNTIFDVIQNALEYTEITHIDGVSESNAAANAETDRKIIASTTITKLIDGVMIYAAKVGVTITTAEVVKMLKSYEPEVNQFIRSYQISEITTDKNSSKKLASAR